MLTDSDIATVNIDLCVLLFILTLKATQLMMCEIISIMHVRVRNDPGGYVYRNYKIILLP